VLYALFRTDHPFGLVFGRLRIGVNRRCNDLNHLEKVGALVEKMLAPRRFAAFRYGADE